MRLLVRFCAWMPALYGLAFVAGAPVVTRARWVHHTLAALVAIGGLFRLVMA